MILKTIQHVIELSTFLLNENIVVRAKFLWNIILKFRNDDDKPALA